MISSVKEFDEVLGGFFPHCTDVVAEMNDPGVIIKMLTAVAGSGVDFSTFLTISKTSRRCDGIDIDESYLLLRDSKSRTAFLLGRPQKIMVARFPRHTMHSFIRVNYGKANAEKIDEAQKRLAGDDQFQVKKIDSAGWLVIYPAGSLLSDQRLEGRIKELAANGRDSKIFKEFENIDSSEHEKSQMEITLSDYAPEDAALWERWLENIDTEMFQTIVRPANFSATSGRSDDYYLKMINYGREKIGAVWLEKINQRTANAELGLIIGEPHLWGMRIGSRAINAIIESASRDLGLRFLWVSVREENQRAVNCYKRCGFQIVRKMPVFNKTDGSYQIWVHMERVL
ncbi:MAG: GNAT family N-acetyltransferase [Bacillota bacterium]